MRLFVDITSHGWGHLSQIAPISEALQQHYHDLELVVRSGIDSRVVTKRLGSIVQFYSSESDFGLVMNGALAVDRALTLSRYQKLHREFGNYVDQIARKIVENDCSAVLSNVGYLAIAAAKRAGVPAIGCSSLNWRDLFEAYCGHLPGASGILDDMDAAYNSADLFVRLAPGMPMPHLATWQISRPIARIGVKRRLDLEAVVEAPARSKIVLCAFGGMLPSEPPPIVWETNDFIVLGPEAWSRYGVIPVDRINLPYEDILASVDVVVTKPGYGIVAELGCTAVPAVLISRGDWPEEPHLVSWLSKHGRFVVLNDIAEVTASNVNLPLTQSPRPGVTTAEPGGEHDVARLIADQLSLS